MHEVLGFDPCKLLRAVDSMECFDKQLVVWADVTEQ